MDKVRQGEVAIELVKYLLKSMGGKIFSSRDLGKELLKAANATAVSVDELKEFLSPLMVDTAKFIVEQGFAQSKDDHYGHDGHGSHGHDGHGSHGHGPHDGHRGCHGCHRGH